MGAFKGRDIEFRWGGAEVPGVRQKGIALGGDPIDITSDEDVNWRTLLDEVSQNQVDLSLSGVTKSGILRNAYFNGPREANVEIEYPDGSVISGSFVLVTYTDTGTYNDAATFDAALQSNGVVTLVGYS